VLPEELNTYDVLVNDTIVFSRASLDAVIARLGRDAAASGATADVDDVDAADDEGEEDDE
jgi:large subunit ribosomal protein L4